MFTFLGSLFAGGFIVIGVIFILIPILVISLIVWAIKKAANGIEEENYKEYRMKEERRVRNNSGKIWK